MFGSATWFVTLNPNVQQWTDLHDIYAKQTGRAVTSETIDDEIQLDPVIFSRYWKLRVQEMLRTVILAEDGPLERVARFFVPEHDANDAIKVEDFYRRMCLLFVPWQEESAILAIYGKETYFETFIAHMNQLKEVSLTAHNEVLDLVEVYKDFKKDCKLAYIKAKQIKEALKNHKVSNEFRLQVQSRRVNVEDHQAKLKLLNRPQKKFFNMVMEGIKRARDGSSALLLYCSGTAGVGKSYVIDLLADALELKYGSKDAQTNEPAVLLAAPTGLAAINIRGQTLHTLLGIKVDVKYTALSDEEKDLRRELFKNVQLLIIDEISMVSAEMLAKINNRLKEITGRRLEDFGGMNVVVFGDLMQLPPVKDTPIFKGLTAAISRNVFGGFGPGMHLWQLFQFYELTQKVRQQHDTSYADVLGRMRLGEMTSEDEEALRSRLIPNDGSSSKVLNAARYHLEIMKKDPFIMTLLPNIIDVDEFNETVLKLMDTPLMDIPAEDSEVNRKRTVKPWQLKRYSIVSKNTTTAEDNTEVPMVAAGLQLKILLALNCRVMLRRTIDRANGLVNGLTGVLVDTKLVQGELYELGIRFDYMPGEVHWIRKVSAMYELYSGQIRSRRQFPIEAVFAVTCHKSQGLTLDNVLMSTESMFVDAQFYVATSRVKTIDGLHLLDLCAIKATANVDAIQEYVWLRTLNKST